MTCWCRSVTFELRLIRLIYVYFATAQDLLNQWVNEKIYLDNEDEFTDDVWTKKTETDIKREWDNLLSDEADLEIEDLASSGKYRNLKSSASNKGTSHNYGAAQALCTEKNYAWSAYML